MQRGKGVYQACTRSLSLTWATFPDRPRESPRAGQRQSKIPPRSGRSSAGATKAAPEAAPPSVPAAAVSTPSKAEGPPVRALSAVDAIASLSQRVNGRCGAQELSAEQLAKKGKGILDEYYSLRDTREVAECLLELKRPDYYTPFLTQGLSRTLEQKETVSEQCLASPSP